MAFCIMVLAFFIGVWINKNNLLMCKEFGFDSTDSSPLRPIIMGSIASALLVILYLCEYTQGELFRFLLLSNFTVFLLRVSAIDHDTLIIPDRITFPLFFTGIFASAISVVSPPFQIWEGLNCSPWIVSLFGATLGFCSSWLFRITTSYVAKQEAFGFGDVLFIGALGAWLGWQLLIPTIIISCFIGLLYALFFSNKNNLAFGPSLAVGAYLAFLLRKHLYINLIDDLWKPTEIMGMFIVSLMLLLAILFVARKVKLAWWSQKLVATNNFPPINGARIEGNFPAADTGWSGKYSGQGRLHNRKWGGNSF